MLWTLFYFYFAPFYKLVFYLFIYFLSRYKENHGLSVISGPKMTRVSFGTSKSITKFSKLSKFLRWSLLIFIIKGFQTIAFIFIVISTTFQPICPLAFFRCLLNLGTFTELRTPSFIESTGVACSDSVSHNWVQVLSIPVLLLTCSQDWTSPLLSSEFLT